MMFGSRTIILMYHRIACVPTDPWSLCVSPAHFTEHLEVLQKYRRSRLDQLKPGGWPLSRGLSVAITFDDGYADNLYNAARELKRFDTPATFFITTGYLGGRREFWWDELERIVPAEDFLAHYESLRPLRHEIRRKILDDMLTADGQDIVCRPEYGPMTQEELRHLAADDLFEIGAHTVTHPLLAAQPLEQQVSEINDSKHWLEGFLNRPVTSFSYPYGGRGHYTDATVAAVKDAGFSRACTTESRPLRRSDPNYEWGRIQVPDVDGDEFQRILFA
jgi:peptidoglycan/xylan/chitin deacetylase (PgdA/CDA1 family)